MPTLLPRLAERSQFGLFDLVETLLVLLVLGISLLHSPDRPPLGAPSGLLARLAQPRWRFALVLVGAGLLLRGALLPLLPPPVPVIPDDFSLLLQAKTFLSGRLANPAHPLGDFFETLYVNQAPAYAAIYFPGRSLPLLLGIATTGHPWAGVWLSMLLLALATGWMLRAFVPAPLALFGGLLVTLRLGVFSYWTNSYFGGGLTALGGVLVIGAFERLRHRTSAGSAVLLAIGVLLLMITRPFEGGLFALPFAVVLARRWLAPQPWRGRAVLALPVAAALIAGTALVTAHNRATTGDPLTTPYGLNRQSFAVAPTFLFQPALTPARTSPDWIAHYFIREAEPHRRAETATGVAKAMASKTLTILLFAIGPAMLIPFGVGLAAWRRAAVPIAGAALMLAGYAVTSWDWAHYLSPALGSFVLVIVIGLERLGGWRWRGRPLGAALTRRLALVPAVMLLLPLALVLRGESLAFSVKRSCCITRTTSPRSLAVARLEALPGRHLVLVRYDAARPLRASWIANDPDIDSARLIWANDLGEARNAELIARYPGHRLWRVTLRDGEVPQLRPATAAPAAAPSRPPA
jgi:hypothetical protein